MRLPDFIIIGAQKCGTSSLYRYLKEHPDIFLPKVKEAQFFAVDDIWHRGSRRYAEQFDSNAAICGEASPQYTWQPWVTEAPKRMHSLIPNAKLIYMVRDPIDRILSQYVDFVHQSWEHCSPEQLLIDLQQQPNKYVQISKYFYQIEAYLNYFSPNQLRVWALEDLAADPKRIMREILEFLGVDSSFTSPNWTVPQNPRLARRRPHALFRKLLKKGTRPERWVMERVPKPLQQPLIRLLHATGSKIVPPTMDPVQESELMDIFRADVKQLRQYTGNPFSKWRAY